MLIDAVFNATHADSKSKINNKKSDVVVVKFICTILE